LLEANPIAHPALLPPVLLPEATKKRQFAALISSLQFFIIAKKQAIHYKTTENKLGLPPSVIVLRLQNNAASRYIILN
jgi:hypothetical protein